MGRFDGFRPDFLPDFPDDGTSGKDWLEWVDELLDNIFGEIPTFDDIREFLEDNSWEDLVPNKSDVSDLITAIYDKIEDEIDPSQYIPNKIPASWGSHGESEWATSVGLHTSTSA